MMATITATKYWVMVAFWVVHAMWLTSRIIKRTRERDAAERRAARAEGEARTLAACYDLARDTEQMANRGWKINTEFDA